jgi:hypothetical protein
MTDLPWFNTKAQVVQVVAAVVGGVIAAVVAWPALQQNQLLSAGPVLFVILVVIAISAIKLLLFPPDAPHEVKVISPAGRVTTKPENDQRYFEIEGTFKQLSAGTEIWAFVKDVSQPRWWPQGPAVLNGTNWTISRVYVGGGDNVKLQVYIVGKSGQALIAYFRLVGGIMRQLRNDVNERAKSIDTKGFKAPAITDLGTDMMCVFDKVMPVQ